MTAYAAICLSLALLISGTASAQNSAGGNSPTGGNVGVDSAGRPVESAPTAVPPPTPSSTSVGASHTTYSCRTNGRLRLGMRYSNWEFQRISSSMPRDGASCIRCALNRTRLAGAKIGGLIWRLGHRSPHPRRQLRPAPTNESSHKSFHQGDILR